MTSDPDQIRMQIEETRSSLSHDVNELADTVNPAQAARRQAANARTAVLGVKDKIMGGTTQSAASAQSAAGDALSGSKDKLRSQTAGNPLAVGLIAVGVGWLLGSLLPASVPEQDAALKVKESVMPLATDTAKSVAGNL